MSTKFYCDVCEEEEGNPKQLRGVSIDNHKTSMLKFDICDKCHKKMFKPVKCYHSSVKITMEFEED